MIRHLVEMKRLKRLKVSSIQFSDLIASVASECQLYRDHYRLNWNACDEQMWSVVIDLAVCVADFAFCDSSPNAFYAVWMHLMATMCQLPPNAMVNVRDDANDLRSDDDDVDAGGEESYF